MQRTCNMKKTFLILFVIFTGLIFLSTNVLAYINPGTGGAIIGSLWPLILVFFSALGAFIVKWFWKPIKRTFSKVLSPIKNSKEDER